MAVLLVWALGEDLGMLGTGSMCKGLLQMECTMDTTLFQVSISICSLTTDSTHSMFSIAARSIACLSHW